MLSLPRLYAILDVDAAGRAGLAPLPLLDLWLDAGVTLVQLRAKSFASGSFLELAELVGARVRSIGGTFVVNDRADIAVMANAHGMHVGQDDLAPADARAVVGPTRLIGVSTHNQPQVAAALEQPVDYLAIGPVFQTSTKDRPDPVVGLRGVTEAASAVARRMPVVAIGGITVERAPAVIDAGADSVAVIADLMGADPAAAARRFVRALA